MRAKLLGPQKCYKEIDVDVIGFQELWHPDALEKAFNVADYDLVSTLISRIKASNIPN